jgi:hypothetical protein
MFLDIWDSRWREFSGIICGEVEDGMFTRVMAMQVVIAM